MKIRTTALGALALLVSFTLALLGCSAEPDVSEVRAQVRKLTVDGTGGNGSGVVIAPGFVLTAQHVAVNPGLELRARGPKGAVLGLGDNDKVDLGLLYFPARGAQCPCAKLAEYEALPDEPIYVVGYPRGIVQALTRGQAQGVIQRLVVPGAWGMPKVLGQRLVFTATIAPGSSGGGVFVFRDGEFQLVGIVVESAGSGMGLAIPLSVVRGFLEEHL